MSEDEGQPPFLDEGFLYCSDQQSPPPPPLLPPSSSPPSKSTALLLSSLPCLLSTLPAAFLLPLFPFIPSSLSLSLATIPASNPRYGHVSVGSYGLLQGTVYMHHMVRNASALVTRAALLQPSFNSIAPLLPLHLSSHSLLSSTPLSLLQLICSSSQSSSMPVPFFHSLSYTRMTLIPRLLCC